MVELLQDAKFPLRKFKLDRQCTPPVAADVPDPIGLKYRRLSLRTKRICHMEQVKAEIARLRMLITHSCRRINELDLELKYLKE